MKKIWKKCLILSCIPVFIFSIIGCSQDSNSANTEKWDSSSNVNSNQTINESYESGDASEGLEFKTNNNGTCAVTGIGTCEDTILTIPTKSRRGDRVVEIGDCAFGYVDACPFVECVNISSTVEVIGPSAFEGTNIKQLYIASSVTKIEYEAFRGCEELEEIKFNCSSNTIIGTSAFSNTYSLKEITIPEGVISIGKSCFAESGLEKVNLPVSLQNINSYAFLGCTDLEEINYAGTRADWMSISKRTFIWDQVPATKINCTDGVIELRTQ